MTLCSDVSDSQLSSEIEGQGRAVSIQGFSLLFWHNSRECVAGSCADIFYKYAFLTVPLSIVFSSS